MNTQNGFWAEWEQTLEKKVLLPVASERMGREVWFTIRMPKAGDVLAGMPDVAVGTPAYDGMAREQKEVTALSWEAWGNALIARSVIDPPTTAEQAGSLTGADRLMLTNEIMAFAAWRRGDQASPFLAAGAADAGAAEPADRSAAERPAA